MKMQPTFEISGCVLWGQWSYLREIFYSERHENSFFTLKENSHFKNWKRYYTATKVIKRNDIMQYFFGRKITMIFSSGFLTNVVLLGENWYIDFMRILLQCTYIWGEIAKIKNNSWFDNVVEFKRTRKTSQAHNTR